MRVREWWIDRITDRKARRPHGRRARAVYGAPDVHSFAWDPVLEALRLGPDDVLLDVGSGGGVFLRRALETGCRATGLDHSREMVRLARETNPEALQSGRFQVVYGTAEALPFTDGEFTALSSIVAFLFFADPVGVLREMRRVLDRERGRLAIFTTPPEAKGHARGALSTCHAGPLLLRRGARAAAARRGVRRVARHAHRNRRTAALRTRLASWASGVAKWLIVVYSGTKWERVPRRFDATRRVRPHPR